MACANAAGKAMPPMIITKGKTTKSLMGFSAADAPENTNWTFQKNGWIDDEIGEKWFNQVFLKFCGPERPQVLILDGHGSHESLAIIERAIAENIIIVALPPHSTHLLQPLDRTVFGPLKQEYNKECSDYLVEHPLHVVNKGSFPTLFKNAWHRALSVSNIKAGFSACGIYPFNPTAIPVSAYDPSKPTDIPVETPPAPVHLSAATVTLPAQPTLPLRAPVTAATVTLPAQQTLPLRAPVTAATVTLPAQQTLPLRAPVTAATVTLPAQQTLPLRAPVTAATVTLPAQQTLPLRAPVPAATVTLPAQQTLPLPAPVPAATVTLPAQQTLPLPAPVPAPVPLPATMAFSDHSPFIESASLPSQYMPVDVQPVMDISDPQVLLDLIRTGDFLIEDIVPDDQLASVSVGPSDSSQEGPEELVKSLFLPPPLKSRAAKKALKPTCHRILTSTDILNEKKHKEDVKREKEAKRAKKIKKEK